MPYGNYPDQSFEMLPSSTGMDMVWNGTQWVQPQAANYQAPGNYTSPTYNEPTQSTAATIVPASVPGLAPTAAQVQANPSAYAGTAFDPARVVNPNGPGLMGGANNQVTHQAYTGGQPAQSAPAGSVPIPGAPGHYLTRSGATWSQPGTPGGPGSEGAAARIEAAIRAGGPEVQRYLQFHTQNGIPNAYGNAVTNSAYNQSLSPTPPPPQAIAAPQLPAPVQQPQPGRMPPQTQVPFTNNGQNNPVNVYGTQYNVPQIPTAQLPQNPFSRANPYSVNTGGQQQYEVQGGGRDYWAARGLNLDGSPLSGSGGAQSPYSGSTGPGSFGSAMLAPQQGYGQQVGNAFGGQQYGQQQLPSAQQVQQMLMQGVQTGQISMAQAQQAMQQYQQLAGGSGFQQAQQSYGTSVPQGGQQFMLGGYPTGGYDQYLQSQSGPSAADRYYQQYEQQAAQQAYQQQQTYLRSLQQPPAAAPAPAPASTTPSWNANFASGASTSVPPASTPSPAGGSSTPAWNPAQPWANATQNQQSWNSNFGAPRQGSGQQNQMYNPYGVRSNNWRGF